jgi:hypothetical protein
MDLGMVLLSRWGQGSGVVLEGHYLSSALGLMSGAVGKWLLQGGLVFNRGILGSRLLKQVYERDVCRVLACRAIIHDHWLA